MNKQRNSAQKAAYFVLALVLGYAAMVLLITVVQEGIFGGVTYYKFSMPVLTVIGALTTMSAVAGGATAALIFREARFAPALVMCGLVVAETTYMISAGKLDGPLWFDIMAAGSLVGGILLGAFIAPKLLQLTASKPVIQKS